MLFFYLKSVLQLEIIKATITKVIRLTEKPCSYGLKCPHLLSRSYSRPYRCPYVFLREKRAKSKGQEYKVHLSIAHTSMRDKRKIILLIIQGMSANITFGLDLIFTMIAQQCLSPESSNPNHWYTPSMKQKSFAD